MAGAKSLRVWNSRSPTAGWSSAFSSISGSDGRIIPACVQNSVLDPGQNRELRRLLPIRPVNGS